MGYFYKIIKEQDKIIYELKTKNTYIFAVIVFLSIIPIVFIAINYFADNINFFRIIFVSLLIVIYAILDGKAIIKVCFTINNKTRTGSLFSFKNPVRYTITK